LPLGEALNGECPLLPSFHGKGGGGFESRFLFILSALNPPSSLQKTGVPFKILFKLQALLFLPTREEKEFPPCEVSREKNQEV
jgi:hypothetical protein